MNQVQPSLKHLAAALAVSWIALATAPLTAPAQATAAKIKLDVVHPEPDEVYWSAQVRYAGSTQPGNQVTVNGEATRVYSSGAFVGLVSLKPGDNEVTFEAVRPTDKAKLHRTLTVKREPLVKASPMSPPQFDFAYAYEPKGRRDVLPGDELIVRFKGSPGLTASFKIGSREQTSPMRELSRGAAGVEGVYLGSYLVQPDDTFVRASISCYLADPKTKAAPKLGLLPKTEVTVLRRETPLLYEPAEGAVDLFTSLECDLGQYVAPPGSLLECSGCVGDKLRFRLAPGLSAWGRADEVKPVKTAGPRPVGRLTSMYTKLGDGTALVTLGLGEKRPFTVIERPEEKRLTLRLYGARLGSFWQAGQTPESPIARIATSRPQDEVLDVDFYLRQPHVWGYRATYSGSNLLFQLRSSPLPADPKHPLKGVCVVLDPGHSGHKFGAVGATGLSEKKINLALARLVAKNLQALGATAKLTHEREDPYLDLNQRAELAEKLKGDLFISIHNDAVGAASDPLSARGSTVFYSQPRCQALGEALYGELRAIDTATDPRGAFLRDLRLTRRCTIMPAALVECRFLTHPEDEMQLLDKKRLTALAEAITKGLVKYAQAEITAR